MNANHLHANANANDNNSDDDNIDTATAVRTNVTPTNSSPTYHTLTPPPPQLHPLQLQHQQQPWLIPHPGLPISWRNNDHAHVSRPTQSPEHSDHGQTRPRYGVDPHHRPEGAHKEEQQSPQQQLSLLRFRGTQRPFHDEDTSYRDQTTDLGHESDPSELMRQPVLFGTSPSNDYLSALDRARSMYPVRRPNRSLSLSMGSALTWPEIRQPSAQPQHSGNMGEVVPYSHEWRVILRSPPRGRTVLYNPQMQSLVVQTTVGLDSHAMHMDESRICALCRRPLDLNGVSDEQNEAENGSSSFMDTNYFRMLADANINLSRRASLQGDTGSTLLSQSSGGTPTSSSRASLDLDARVREEVIGSNTAGLKDPSHLSHDALNQGYYQRFFVEQVKLGRGYRGSVFLCQHILDGIHLGEYAIKKVAVGDNHDWLVQMLREVHLLERLHHPNIVSYKHAWLENHQLHKFSPEVTCLFILMECANGGNLEEYIERSPEMEAGTSHEAGDGKKVLSARERILLSKRGSIHSASSKPGGEGSSTDSGSTSRHYLSITEIWSFFFDICEGLAHLHRLGIIHRDLKPPNLLLSYSDSRVKGTKGERPRILITDFGECEILDQGVKRDRTGATGTLEFLAPELLTVDAEGKYTDEFSFKGDMWSLGMVLYYLCYSRLPYTQIDDVDILREEIRGFRSISLPRDDRGIPEELKILIRVLLSTDKSKRPSCDDILSSLSLQRDRMMHGDMDSPVTPIHTSSDSSRRMGAASSSTDSDSELVSESSRPTTTATKARGKSAAHTLRPASNPSTQFVALQRRKSRTPLVIADHHKPSNNNALSGGARNIASSSVNLHKKGKPLGLGLRHMLRRRMLHPTALKAQQHHQLQHHHNHHQHSRSQSLDNALKLSSPTDAPLVVSSFAGSLGTTGQHQTDTLHMQQVQARKNAARKSMLGSEIQSQPTSSPQLPRSLTQSSPNTNTLTQSDSESKDMDVDPDARQQQPQQAIENNEKTVNRRRTHADPGWTVRAPIRGTEFSDGTDDPESGDDDDHPTNGKVTVGSFSAASVTTTAAPGKTKSDEQKGLDQQILATSSQLARDPTTYWTNLATNHAQEISRTGSAVVDQVGAAVAVADQTNASPSSSSTFPYPEGATSWRQKRREEDGSSVNSHVRPNRHRPSKQTGIQRKSSHVSSEIEGTGRPFNDQANKAAVITTTTTTITPSSSAVVAAATAAAATSPATSVDTTIDTKLSPQRQQRRRRLRRQRRMEILSRDDDGKEEEAEDGGRLRSTSKLSEQFSVHFMFLSLIFRIWFCQWLCNPVMVRPIVLYPVLVLTVIWDRYLLSVLEGRFVSRGRRDGRDHGYGHGRGLGTSGSGDNEDHEAEEEGEDEEEGQMDDDDDDDDDEGDYLGSNQGEGDLRRRRYSRRHRYLDAHKTTEEVRQQIQGTNRGDKEEEIDEEEGNQMMTKERTRIVWQAFLSGIVVQLIWIGLVRLFSRSG
ncbi:putative serine/threonine-protein kinase iks1, partial [Podila humilis]